MSSPTRASEYDDCPQCDGTGSYGAGDDALCEWCDGRGRVTNAVWDAWAEEQERFPLSSPRALRARRGGPLL